MNRSQLAWCALGLMSATLGACHACDSKTPVPFKRVGNGGADAGPAVAQATVAAPADQAANSYPEGTQKLSIGDTLIDRPQGTIRASLTRDLNADKQPDVLVVTTDAEGQPALETILHAATEASGRLALAPYAGASSCRAVAAKLALLGEEFGAASVDFLCDPLRTPIAAPSDVPAAPSGGVDPAAAAPPPALDLAPPEPSAASAQTHHFVFDLTTTPQLLLHLAAIAGEDAGPTLDLALSGSDVDADEHADVQLSATLAQGSADSQPQTLTLTWFSRPSGFARDRQEPEHSLADLAKEAWKQRESKPQLALATADRALALHRALCRETGRALLWVDHARGVPCGASSSAGKLAAARTIAFAKQQALLAALDARNQLDDPAFALDAKSRDAVARAIAAVRGESNYRWQQGPPFSAPTSPNLRLPALGFIDEDHLLLRGAIAQSYDLIERTTTPTGVPGSVLAADAANHYVLTDIVRTCDGYHLRVVPASQVIGGVVTGASTSEPLLLAAASGLEPSQCAANAKKSDRGGFVLLAMLPGGALLARSTTLTFVALDDQGRASALPRTVAANESITAPAAPGALDASARHYALTTSEGMLLVDRTNPQASKLVRPPPSCVGSQVSDAALSPSGRKLAMLCAGHIYLAEPAADSGGIPIPEHP